MALLDLSSEIVGTLPGLNPLLAEKFIQRAWQDVQRERRWSFLQMDGVLVCPVMFTTGTYAITQYTDTVTANAAASALLLPYVTGTPLATQLQIRFGGTSTLTVGQIYRIMEVDITNPAALVLTLDRAVVEITNATSTYQCYRCYVTPPQSNFLAWDQIVDMSYGFNLKLNYTSGEFDARDPQRTAQGDAYYCGFFRAAGPYGTPSVADQNQAQGAPIFELWPHPVSGRTFYVRYHRKGWDLTLPTDTQPTQIDDNLILARAYGWHAYQFAQANTQNFPTLKNANWMGLILSAKAEYKDLLKAAKRSDDAQALTSVWNRGHGLRGGSGVPMPIDAAFIQAHLLNF